MGANNPGYYQRSKKAYKIYRRRVYDKKMAIVQALRNRPCVDCGQVFPSVCMEFDHARGGKKGKRTISAAVSALGFARLLEEIAKCDVVCANCHNIRTFARGENRRGGYYPE